MISYALAYRDAFGNLLTVIDNFTTLEYARVVNKTGALRLVIPDQWDSRRNLSTYDIYSAIDSQIEVWRQVGNDAPRLAGETAWFVRGPGRRLEEKGQRMVEIKAVDAVELLKRRYVSNLRQPLPRAHADDFMKGFVSNQLAADPDTTRNLPAANFSVAPFLSQIGEYDPGVETGMKRPNLLDLCQGLANAAATGGEYLAFDIVQVYPNHFQFRTYAAQRGVDHRFPSGSGSPILIDPEMGGISNITAAEDWTEEWNVATSVGNETELGAFVDTAYDTERMGLSLWNRREISRATGADSHAASLDAARALLREGRPRRSFAGRLLSSPAFQFGKQYGFGDIVTANYINRQYNVRLDGFAVRFGSGAEEIDVVVKADEVIN